MKEHVHPSVRNNFFGFTTGPDGELPEKRKHASIDILLLTSFSNINIKLLVTKKDLLYLEVFWMWTRKHLLWMDLVYLGLLRVFVFLARPPLGRTTTICCAYLVEITGLFHLTAGKDVLF